MACGRASRPTPGTRRDRVVASRDRGGNRRRSSCNAWSLPGALIHPPLKSAPVTSALEPHDPTEARRLEVAGRHDDLLALEPLEQRAPCLSRHLGIHVGTRDPVRFLQLYRTVCGVAEHERALAT